MFRPDLDGGVDCGGPTLLNSPVEERHIDFLLEEEFNCNEKFLTFFLDAAQEHFKPRRPAVESLTMLQPSHEWNCRSIRSVTTEDGETDVMVVYHSTATPNRVAVLIEDKIRAGFQPDQPERYQQRGEAGVPREWDSYWTCLISPEKYTQDNKGFDTRVSLEKLATFFSGVDARSRFKAEVLQGALKHFENTGLQKKDEMVTQFRAFYAQQAASFFAEGEVNWPKARDAWWGDTWFTFTSGGLPRGVTITYKASPGFVDLAFPGTREESLEQVLERF